MFQRIGVQRRPRPGSRRRVGLTCLLLALTATLSLPLYSASSDDAGSACNLNADIELRPELLAGAPPDNDRPADVAQPEHEASAGPVTSVRSGKPEGTGDPVTPGRVLIVEQNRPTGIKHTHLSRTPLRLAAAGLLLIPLDAGLMKIIPHTSAEQRADDFTETVNKLGGREGMLATIGGLYLLGNDYDKDTAKLALAAVANATIATEGIKLLTGRERPDVSDGLLKFRGPGLDGEGRDSFPSGHTSAAFAVATVLAERHPKQKWLYYSLATAVGFARVRKSAHFPSDVLVGAAIGIQAGNNALRKGPRIFSIKL